MQRPPPAKKQKQHLSHVQSFQAKFVRQPPSVLTMPPSAPDVCEQPTASGLAQKNKEADTAFAESKWEVAYEAYTEALSMDPLNTRTNAILYCSRAAVLLKQDKLDEAVEDYTKAIELQAKYLKAYQRRAKCYMEQENYEAAVRDYSKVLEMKNTTENKRLLQNAQLELNKTRRKDNYSILGLQKTAGEYEIRKSYRKLALLFHPDRHMNASHAKRKEQERKFKIVGAAYAVLSDTKKKQQYDNAQRCSRRYQAGRDRC